MSQIGSFFTQNGISISAFKPTVNPSAGSYEPRGQEFDKSMINRLVSYSHSKNSKWGYKSVGISITGPIMGYLDKWYDEGLGVHIEVYNKAGGVIMAGFVNRVTLSSGTLSASRGPLVDLCNRCSVIYTPIIDVSVSPPLTGAEKSTVIAEDSSSQEKYGIIEKVLSGGQLLDDGTTDEAEDYRDRYLDENREPGTGDKGLSLGNAGEATIQLEVLGYYAWLNLYIYSTILTGTTTVSAKMQSVLGADPTGIFSTNYSGIETNSLLTPVYDNDNRTAQTIIEKMVERGNDTDDTRRIFGVFDEQKVVYKSIPDEFDYLYRISSRDQKIRRYSTGNSVGNVVDPWDVEAGKWLFLGDWLPGRFTSTVNKKDDPRAMFLEDVTFNAPYGLSMNGVGISELPQYLAKLGVS